MSLQRHPREGPAYFTQARPTQTHAGKRRPSLSSPGRTQMSSTDPSAQPHASTASSPAASRRSSASGGAQHRLISAGVPVVRGPGDNPPESPTILAADCAAWARPQSAGHSRGHSTGASSGPIEPARSGCGRTSWNERPSARSTSWSSSALAFRGRRAKSVLTFAAACTDGSTSEGSWPAGSISPGRAHVRRTICGERPRADEAPLARPVRSHAAFSRVKAYSLREVPMVCFRHLRSRGPRVRGWCCCCCALDLLASSPVSALPEVCIASPSFFQHGTAMQPLCRRYVASLFTQHYVCATAVPYAHSVPEWPDAFMAHQHWRLSGAERVQLRYM